MKEYLLSQGIITRKGKYLIGKRAFHKKFSPGKWEFIAGFVDEGETPQETIIRELKEETGIQGKVVKICAPYEVPDNEGMWKIFPFVIEADNNFKINKEDHEELKWIRASELENYPDLSEDLKHLKKYL